MVDFKEHNNTMTEEEAQAAVSKLTGILLYDSYVNSALIDQFGHYEKSKFQAIIYNLKYMDLPLISDWNKEGFIDEDVDTIFKYWLIFQQEVYDNPLFPFGYLEKEYERHMKIMKRRLEDVKSKQLIPPNFKSNKSFGLDEMMEFIDKRKFACNEIRPLVKGKTLMMPAFLGFRIEEQKFSNLSRYLYINKFDNVEIPAKYFIKYDYATESNYFMDSFLAKLRILEKWSIKGYEDTTKYLCEYEIICFNLFLFPIRDKHIESFMNFIIAFQVGHPKIYIKDVSGKGYSIYKKYSFYEKLRNSRIDVSLIK